MELNREQIKKALDWLDSLVGNSNDSDIALLTYQLLGILYDTCEELTEENERLKELNSFAEIEKRILRKETIRKMQERLHERFKSDANLVYSNYNIHRYIDQIAKEMLEVADDNT